MISESISKKVLTVGENYIDHRGGISAVINTYSHHFPDFKFVSTYQPVKNKIEVIPNFLKGILQLRKKLKSDKDIQIVHIHGAAKGSVFRKFIVAKICKSHKKKVIYHSHGSEFKKFYQNSPWFVKNVVQQLINKHVDVVVCLSKQWELFFKENFKARQIVILENIVERPEFIKQETDKLIKFLFLGYIGKRKGIFDLLQVIKQNITTFSGKIKLIVGGNGETESLMEFITTNKLESVVQYEGWVSGNKKQILLNSANVYILPSYNEGLPISILEAMSYGLPIISTPVGGITEVVHDGVNGFIVKPGDEVAISEKICLFIENPKLLETMGYQSSEIVKPYYSENVIPKLETLYVNLLNLK